GRVEARREPIEPRLVRLVSSVDHTAADRGQEIAELPDARELFRGTSVAGVPVPRAVEDDARKDRERLSDDDIRPGARLLVGTRLLVELLELGDALMREELVARRSRETRIDALVSPDASGRDEDAHHRDEHPRSPPCHDRAARELASSRRSTSCPRSSLL